MTILLTGAAGFIGHQVASALLARGERVIGVDNVNDYYAPTLKRARLSQLQAHDGFVFHEINVADREAVFALASKEPAINQIIHLAAQAGVRRSLVDPYSYVTSNVMGHVVILEMAARLKRLDHLVYASSSSVYGRNDALPFREDACVDLPGSLYAMTKRAGELSAQTYSHLYGLRQTGLRFFTVYGPWGRPDMAYYGFTRAIEEGQPITLYQGSNLSRDFTYIDDVVDAVLRVLALPPAQGESRLLNIGNDRPEPVTRMIELLEKNLGKKAIIQIEPRPAADMESTWASVESINALTGWKPRTSLDEGIARFVTWYRGYDGV